MAFITSDAGLLLSVGRLSIGVIALLRTLVFTQAGMALAGRIASKDLRTILISMFVLMEIGLLAGVVRPCIGRARQPKLRVACIQPGI